MNRALKSLNRWRSELWEAGKTNSGAKEKRYFKRSAARAQRRVSRSLCLEHRLESL